MTELENQHFKAWWVDEEEFGRALMIQQSEVGDYESVMLHPNQLRHICEHFGILAADEQAEKAIATLKRRLLALRDRIVSLEAYMAQHSDHKHADLSYEMVNLSAMADLASEWCADFDASDGVKASREAQPISTEVQAPAVQGELL